MVVVAPFVEGFLGQGDVEKKVDDDIGFRKLLVLNLSVARAQVELSVMKVRYGDPIGKFSAVRHG